MVTGGGAFDTAQLRLLSSGGICTMSKRLTVTTFALVLAIAAPFAIAQEKAASTEKAAPRLTLVEPLKDFGTVPKGEKITYNFEVKNTGTADLEIIAAKPTCGC